MGGEATTVTGDLPVTVIAVIPSASDVGGRPAHQVRPAAMAAMTSPMPTASVTSIPPARAREEGAWPKSRTSSPSNRSMDAG